MSPLVSPALAALDWIEHGFGTRHDGMWTPRDQTARLHQIHTDQVVSVTEPGHHGSGDALITAQPGLWLEIRTADCVPILVADSRRRVIAAIHAGWRGTAAAIARITIEELCRRWGSQPVDLQVAIGPSIGDCCFAVGEDVATHFPGYITRSHPQPHVDLVSANQEQLTGAGVPAAQIEGMRLCTVCDPGSFYSFRRDKGDGRMVTAIRIRQQTPD
jgi:polyphenol oxidase